jgi:hypothetical protein
MRNKTEPTEANREYATAYAAHYTERDLPSAMRLYKQIMASHPSDPEAEYSRAQIQNIVSSVVPRQELLDVQMKLAATHFEHSA